VVASKPTHNDGAVGDVQDLALLAANYAAVWRRRRPGYDGLDAQRSSVVAAGVTVVRNRAPSHAGRGPDRRVGKILGGNESPLSLWERGRG